MLELVRKILVVVGITILLVATFVSSCALLIQTMDLGKFVMGLVFGVVGVIVIAFGVYIMEE